MTAGGPSPPARTPPVPAARDELQHDDDGDGQQDKRQQLKHGCLPATPGQSGRRMPGPRAVTEQPGWKPDGAAISLLIAGSVGDRQVLLRVIVPFGALYLAYRYTQKQAAQAQDPTVHGESAASGSALPTPASPSH